MPDRETLASLIADARRAVVFTGAGISTESGIPDYRSPGGVWSRTTAIQFQDFVASPEIRRDTVRTLRAAAADTRFLLAAAERLPDFRRPALVAWASEDRVMPPEHGRRLAALLPQGQLTEIDDSYTLVPLDQPARLAQVIR